MQRALQRLIGGSQARRATHQSLQVRYVAQECTRALKSTQGDLQRVPDLNRECLTAFQVSIAKARTLDAPLCRCVNQNN